MTAYGVTKWRLEAVVSTRFWSFSDMKLIRTLPSLAGWIAGTT